MAEISLLFFVCAIEKTETQWYNKNANLNKDSIDNVISAGNDAKITRKIIDV